MGTCLVSRGGVLELLLFLFFLACLQQQQQHPSALGAEAPSSSRSFSSRRSHRLSSSLLENEYETVVSEQPSPLTTPSMKPRRGLLLRRDRASALALVSLSIPAFLALLWFRRLFSSSKKPPTKEELPDDDGSGPAGGPPPSSPEAPGAPGFPGDLGDPGTPGAPGAPETTPSSPLTPEEEPLWLLLEGPPGGPPGEPPTGAPHPSGDPDIFKGRPEEKEEGGPGEVVGPGPSLSSVLQNVLRGPSLPLGAAAVPFEEDEEDEEALLVGTEEAGDPQEADEDEDEDEAEEAEKRQGAGFTERVVGAKRGPSGPLEGAEEEPRKSGRTSSPEPPSVEETAVGEASMAVKVSTKLSPPPTVAGSKSWKPTGDEIEDLVQMLYLWKEVGIERMAAFSVESDATVKGLLQLLGDGLYLRTNAEEILKREKEKGGGSAIDALENDVKRLASNLGRVTSTVEDAFFKKYNTFEQELRRVTGELTSALQRGPHAPSPHGEASRKAAIMGLLKKVPLPGKSGKAADTLTAGEVIQKIRETAEFVQSTQEFCGKGNPFQQLKLESPKLSKALSDLENLIKEAVKVLNDGYKSYEKDIANSPGSAATLTKKNKKGRKNR